MIIHRALVGYESKTGSRMFRRLEAVSYETLLIDIVNDAIQLRIYLNLDAFRVKSITFSSEDV